MLTESECDEASIKVMAVMKRRRGRMLMVMVVVMMVVIMMTKNVPTNFINFILNNVNTDCDRSNGNYEDDNGLISMLINMLIMRFLVMMTIMCFIAWGNGRLPEL